MSKKNKSKARAKPKSTDESQSQHVSNAADATSSAGLANEVEKWSISESSTSQVNNDTSKYDTRDVTFPSGRLRVSPWVGRLIYGDDYLEATFPLLRLPPELLLQIASHMYDEDVIALSQVCKKLRKIYTTYTLEHVVISHDLPFDNFLKTAVRTPSLPNAQIDDEGKPVAASHTTMEPSTSNDTAVDKMVEQYQRIRHLTIRSEPSDDILVPHYRDHSSVDSHTFGLWSARIGCQGGLFDIVDRVVVALSFLPRLESLNLYYPHLMPYDDMGRYFEYWTPNLKRIGFYTNSCNANVLIRILQGCSWLEEVEVSGLDDTRNQHTSLKEAQSRLLTDALLSMKNLRHFSLVRGSYSYNDEKDREVPFDSIEDSLFGDWARLSISRFEQGVNIKHLTSLRLRNLNINHHRFSEYLSSPASGNLRHLVIKLYISDQEDWNKGIIFTTAASKKYPYTCFWNAKTDLKLACGLSDFSVDVFKIIGSRIQTLKLFNHYHTKAAYISVPLFFQLGCFPRLSTLHIIQPASHDDYNMMVRNLGNVLTALKSQVEVIYDDFEETEYYEYTKGEGWNGHQEGDTVDDEEVEEGENEEQATNAEGDRPVT